MSSYTKRKRKNHLQSIRRKQRKEEAKLGISCCSFEGCSRPVCAKGLCNSHWSQQHKFGYLKPIFTSEDTPENRFWSQVDKLSSPEGCWLWIGLTRRYKNGKTKVTGFDHSYYGVVYYRGKKWQAHRFSYELHRGVIPTGIQVDHLCRNKACVNPDHLELVTHNVNIQRMMAYHALTKEIKRLRDLICKLGGDPGDDILAI